MKWKTTWTLEIHVKITIPLNSHFPSAVLWASSLLTTPGAFLSCSFSYIIFKQWNRNCYNTFKLSFSICSPVSLSLLTTPGAFLSCSFSYTIFKQWNRNCYNTFKLSFSICSPVSLSLLTTPGAFLSCSFSDWTLSTTFFNRAIVFSSCLVLLPLSPI